MPQPHDLIIRPTFEGDKTTYILIEIGPDQEEITLGTATVNDESVKYTRESINGYSGDNWSSECDSPADAHKAALRAINAMVIDRCEIIFG